jgi:hypothetical protein
MIRTLYLILFSVCMWVGTTTEGLAHTKSLAFSKWEISGTQLVGIYTVDARRATYLYALGDKEVALPARTALHLSRFVQVVQQGNVCDAAAPKELRASPEYMRVELSYDCPEPIDDVPVTVELGAFFPISATHIHIARVQEGSAEREVVLNSAVRFFSWGQGVQQAGTFVSFAIMGAEHVLGGFDHLAFLAALLLLCGAGRQIIITVTGFTLGHSVTIALVTLGVLSPASGAVEAMIGFSIAFAAFEVLWKQRPPSLLFALSLGLATLILIPFTQSVPPAVLVGLALFVVGMAIHAARVSPQTASAFLNRMPLILATTFGLVHGAGFAGALLDLNLPTERLVTALVGFNLGVELGQLALVAPVAFFALKFGGRLAGIAPTLKGVASLSLVFIGIFWFVARTLGA